MLYEYTAVDLKNKRIKGVVDAATAREVKTILKEKKLLIISIKAREKSSLFAYFNKKKKARLNFVSLVNFTRQMGIMINAGLSIVDSLNILSSQAKNLDEKTVISKLEEYIKGGTSLSEAMKNFQSSFPPYYISLIKAGESSGKLDDVFLRLAENLEKAREFRGKVTSSLIYPIVIIVGILAVAFIMITFVLPRLLELYKNFNVDLPVSTKVIIAVSSFFSKFWPLIITGLTAIVIAIKAISKSPKNKKIIDAHLLGLPVFGPIIQKSILVEITRTLSILIKSGVPILESLNIAKDITNNVLYQEALSIVYENVEKGMTLGDALAATELFPSIFVQMTAVGERTGKLDDTLIRLSTYFQMETELAVKAATTLIEPAILVVLGVGVGFLVLSVLTPIYSLTSSFGAAQ